jgi:ABC-type ATPase involved in cell division
MIELEGVDLTLRGRREISLFRGLSLKVAAGEVLLLSGASGCGKTALLDLLIGTRQPDAGTVKLFDRDIARLRRSSLAFLRRLIGVVPQEILLLDDRTALDNVALPLEIRAVARTEIRRRATDALSTVGLAHAIDAPVATLATSERRLVALARALVSEPSMVLADEPTSDLDSIRKDELCSLIDELRTKQTTCVITTNDPQLLGTAALCGWRQCELRGGVLHAGDHDLFAASAPESRDADHDVDIDVEEPEVAPNVVRFPYAAGGVE